MAEAKKVYDNQNVDFDVTNETYDEDGNLNLVIERVHGAPLPAETL